MRRLEIKNEYKVLISSVIEENPKYRGNEHLMDAFLEVMYKKASLLLDAIKDKSRLKRHLAMLSDGCMNQVIKQYKAKEETKLYKQVEQNVKKRQNIVSLKKDIDKNLSYTKEAKNGNIVNLREEIENKERYNNVNTVLDPLEFYSYQTVSENTVDKLMYIIRQIDLKFPQKRYYDIFSLRYIKKYSQSQMAQELKISQTELSKRFVEMIKLTRESL